VEAYKQDILTEWESMPPAIVTSSLRELGRDEILQFIHETNAIFVKQVQ
jgi:hypothetical protein